MRAFQATIVGREISPRFPQAFHLPFGVVEKILSRRVRFLEVVDEIPFRIEEDIAVDMFSFHLMS